MNETDPITVGHAFKAMFEFIHAYWERGGRHDDQIADMLSSMQFGSEEGPTKTIDPAQWLDWLDAVKKIT